MARDVRNAVSGLDRNKYYKAEYVNQNKLTQDAVVQGVFYSYDIGEVTEESVVQGVTKTIIYRVQIETYDIVTDLQVDDFVYYSGELWKVEKIGRRDKINKAKPFNRRQFITRIDLRRG